ncbi:PAS domain S-box-containing protein [Thermosyntropha lipolytica DSM 11003]|uniref:HTH-type transcriptional regulatory protein TyrR n=1 Tax=Thermosyntropha lipolytica DSM 11003 TaxID=1123382 RepID=A0A1M5PDR2_9FIRM|nr:sigma 54-interacting transcriptional regulator [Thermosyntropha lipolytica]SHG99858.1 PAS domain S-box-containing protein [Thermosyntropha lipolytica DSM 11003]
MKIKNFMSTEIIKLDPELSLQQACRIFLEKKIDGAPVVKEGKIIGLLTKTHILRAFYNGVSPGEPVKNFMTREVKYLHPDTDIRDVDIMYTGRYPVLEGEKLVGFITKSDIMRGLNRLIDEMSGQLEAVINSAYNPIIAIDREGKIRIWNKAAEKLADMPAEKVMGKFINDVIPESELFNIVKTGKTEYGIKLKINNISVITNRAPILENGVITGAVAVLYDVSEIEKISQELEYVKSLNRELDAIFEASFDGLYITDGKGKTLRINKAIKRMTGLGEKELLHKTMNELVANGTLSRSATLIVLEKKKPITTTLTTITGKTLLVSAVPVFDEQGEIVRVVTNVRDISELNRLKQKIEQLEGLKKHYESQVNQLKEKFSGRLVFKSKVMEDIIYQAARIAEVDTTVLITGESGTGKEVIAEIIQKNSNRRDKPFIKINCAALPENLIESELFGYEAGAFTGAKREGKPGMFELADGGTLLLDEIGELPLHLQVKLLRALQQQEIFRVGGTKPVKVDVRIIAVTNRDLEKQVRIGEFRKDLYYRINVVPLNIPPLRERREDIPILIKHFLDMFNKRYNMNKKMSGEVVEVLTRYYWPGNIRQLENLLERLVITSNTELISLSDLPEYILSHEKAENEEEEAIVVNRVLPLKQAVEITEKKILEKAWQLYNSCQKTAEALEVDPATVSRKMRKYKIANKKNHK